MAKLTAEQIKEAKIQGFLHDKNTEDKFNGRVVTGNGKITSEELSTVAEAAEKFGSGEVTLTTRLTMEIQGVDYENIKPLQEFLGKKGLYTGGTGEGRVRPVVCCKGTTCKYGLIDTFTLSEEIHKRFFVGYKDVALPHKFKMAVGGCPNNCVKPDLNDLGVIGQRVPTVDVSKCKGCGKCRIEISCPIGASKKVDGRITFDPEICNHCGRCKDMCPFKAYDNYTDGYKIYLGGRWGKKFAKGNFISKIFTDKDEVLDVVENSILFFKDNAFKGERFAECIERIGFETVEKTILSGDCLARKEEILSAPIKTRE